LLLDTGNADVVIVTPVGNKATIKWSPNSYDQEKLSQEGIIGKFSVQYDISREANAGEILVT